MDTGLVLISMLSALLFALALVLTQFGLRTVPPMTGAAISVPTTAALFLALSPLTVAGSGWNDRSALTFAVAGLFFPACVTLLTFASNRSLGPNLTGALGNLSPLFAVALAVLLLGESPRAGQIAGVLAVCAGVLVLAIERARSHKTDALWLLLLPIAAAFLRGLVQPIVKIGLQSWPNAFAAATIGYGVSAIVLTLARQLSSGGTTGTLGRGWLWFVVVGICNGAAVLTLYLALARGPVSIVAPLVACYPLATLVLNWMIHKDRSISVTGAGAITVTVAGIALLLAS